MEITDGRNYGKPWPFRTRLAVPITIRQYISREQLCTGCAQPKTPSFCALDKCFAIEVETRLNITSLFWSTQTRMRQQYNCAPILQPIYDEPRYLCVKCGRWDPCDALSSHLPIAEIRQFMRSHPARAWEVLDATSLCLAKMEERYSLEEDQSMRVQALNSEDWPAVCSKCNCVVTSSLLAVHRSNPFFCRHARLTWIVSNGHLARNRFNWYPGHPLVHHFHVGKWNTLVVIGACSFCRNKIRALYKSTLLLCALGKLRVFDHVAKLVLDFGSFHTSTLYHEAQIIHSIINDGVSK